jgi:hypothetical protein
MHIHFGPTELSGEVSNSQSVEAHDPSRARDGNVPPPDDILADIKVLADWAQAIRKKQAALA